MGRQDGLWRMLKLLANLSPIFVLLIGAIPAAGIGWFARDLTFNVFERPTIIREATKRADDACTIRVMAAAEAAEEAAQARIAQAGADALAAYQKAAETRERLRAEINARLENEISNLERTLDAQGRSCLLNNDDVGVFTGPQPAPANLGR
jgi:hypothetical protein